MPTRWLQQHAAMASQQKQRLANLLRLAIVSGCVQNLMREYMRNNDRALSNIEALPGGFNALRQLYENVQVCLLLTQQSSAPARLISGAAEQQQSNGLHSNSYTVRAAKRLLALAVQQHQHV
jgi:hypothetical protein